MLTGPGEKIQMMDREKCDGYESDPARQESLQPVSQHAEEGGQVWDSGLATFSSDLRRSARVTVLKFLKNS